MRRFSLQLPALAALAVGGLVCATGGAAQQGRPAGKPLPAAPAAATAPAVEAPGTGPVLKPPPAGQLTLVDRTGQPAGECPLKHTDVKASVTGFVARVSVSQEFENTASGPVEAVYTFPLPEDAAVDDMTMTIGDRVIRGQIKKRDEARRIYEAARAAGQSAALLDQERPNIFTQSVANLMPGQKIRIALSYVNLLKYDEGQYEFSFPMVVGPRYSPGGGPRVPGRRGDPSPAPRVEPVSNATSVVTDADKISPPITPQGTRAGHDISLEVALTSAFPIREVRSQLHEVVLDKQSDKSLTVRLREQKSIPNKDFILKFRVDGDQVQAGMLAQADGKGGYFTLIMQPPSAPAQTQIAPKEMVFVIDQTGSQSGWPIQKAKETMRFCIENLNPGDTFQLIGFNTQIFPCFGQPVPATESNVQQALRFLEPIEGRGGTDILKSVDYALKMPDDPARPRIICYMTDGYVGNDMQVIDYIRKNRGRARMFPFGIGNSVNRFLIDQMAVEGRGAAYYVTLNTPGEEAASKFYARVAKPLLLDVSVEWNGMPVADVFPRHIPDVFSSTPIILKGRYTTPAQGEVTVKGLLRGQPWSQQVKVELPNPEKDGARAGASIPSLWAREKIADLQAQDWLGQQTGNVDPKIQDAIVGLALDYRLMSQHTSFVAVEEKVVNVGGRMRRVDVPVEMPEGVSYEGIFGGEAQTRAGAAALGLKFGSGGMMGGMGGANASSALYAGAAVGQARGLSVAPGQQPQRFYRYAIPAPKAKGDRADGLAAAKKLPQPASAAAPAIPTPAPVGAPGPSGPPGPPGVTPTQPQKQASEYRQKTRKEVDALREAEKPGDGEKVEAGNKVIPVKLTAAQQAALLLRMKTVPALHGLAEKLKKQGKAGNLQVAGEPEVRNGRVTVQIWVSELTPEVRKKLAAAGFQRAGDLLPGRVVLGSIPVAHLPKLVKLDFVQMVDVPKFLD